MSNKGQIKKNPKHDEIVSSTFENLIVAKEFFEMR